jgi:hypothetical protein
MTTTDKSLRIEKVEQIVRDLLKASSQFTKLDEASKASVTLGITMRKTYARCMAYIPGERRELGTIIAVFDVDRKTGDAKAVAQSEW